MKKISKNLIRLMMIIMVFSLSIIVVKAQTQPYTVLAPLPGTTSCGQNGGTNCTTSIAQYIPGAFNLAIGVSAVLAFVMITFGGIMYATSDAITGKSQGREYAENAIYGLLLVLGAYAILNTINPDLLRINLTITPTNLAGGTTSVVPGGTPGQCPPCSYSTSPVNGRQILNGYVMTQAQIDSDRENRNNLVSVNRNNPPCLLGETRGCTNLNDLGGAIAGLNELARACRCGTLVVTGGSEGGHESHGPNKSVVDIQPGAINTLVGIQNPVDGQSKIVERGATRAEFTYEAAGGGSGGASTGAHWHVVFK